MQPPQATIGTCYRIRNKVNGKSYVGSTVYFDHRRQCHLIALTKGTHHSPKLQNSWNKHGEINFEWEVLETIENVEHLPPKEFAGVLLPREDFYIAHYDSIKHGYNVCPIAGTSLGVRRTQEIKDFLRERRLAYIASNSNYGAEHGQRMQEYYAQHPEARDEMREIKAAFHEANPQAAEEARARAVKQFSDPAVRQAASERQLAFLNSAQQVAKRKHRDADIRQKLLNGMTVREIAAELHTSSEIVLVVRKGLVSEGLLSGGNKHSEKTREKMRKPKSEETKARMSAAQTGREVSDDAREKIRQNSINQFSDPTAREAASKKALAFYNSPKQVAKRELRDGPIREMLLNGIKQKEIVRTLGVSASAVYKVSIAMKAATA